MAILRKKYAKENIAIEAKRKRRPVWRRSGRKKPVFKKESTAQVASSASSTISKSPPAVVIAFGSPASSLLL